MASNAKVVDHQLVINDRVRQWAGGNRLVRKGGIELKPCLKGLDTHAELKGFVTKISERFISDQELIQGDGIKEAGTVRHHYGSESTMLMLRIVGCGASSSQSTTCSSHSPSSTRNRSFAKPSTARSR